MSDNHITTIFCVNSNINDPDNEEIIMKKIQSNWGPESNQYNYGSIFGVEPMDHGQEGKISYYRIEPGKKTITGAAPMVFKHIGDFDSDTEVAKQEMMDDGIIMGGKKHRRRRSNKRRRTNKRRRKTNRRR